MFIGLALQYGTKPGTVRLYPMNVVPYPHTVKVSHGLIRAIHHVPHRSKATPYRVYLLGRCQCDPYGEAVGRKALAATNGIPTVARVPVARRVGLVAV